MKKQDIKYLALIFVFLALSVILPSCNGEGNASKNTGILADRNVISSIRQEIADKENSSLAVDGDVFWTASGALWHASYNCSYLSNSKTVYHGTIDEAKLLGKSRECERCGTGGGEKSIYEEIEDNEVAKGDVFFTEDDTLWHSKEDCPVLLSLSPDTKIYHSNRALAFTLGKMEECEECKDKE